MDQNENLTPPIDTPTPVEAPVPAPEAPQEIPTPQEAPAPQASPEPEPAKKSKAVIWLLSILLILAIAAAAVFAYFYFTGQTSQPAPQGGSSEITPTPDNPDNPVEETDITDQALIHELDEKVSILHIGRPIDNPIVFKYSVSQPGGLYVNGTIDRDSKLQGLLEYLERDYSEQLTEEELSHLKSVHSGMDAKLILDFSIDGDLVAQKYKDTFGEELTHGGTNKACVGYNYDATYNFYYHLDSTCGGMTPIISIFYKNRYTVEGDKAYVYISAVMVNEATSPAIVYCEIKATTNDSDTGCDTLAEGEEFTLNETNYQNYGQYRFVFKKTDAGTYYFEKVEKL